MEYRGEFRAKLPIGENKVSAMLYREGNEIYGNLADGGTVKIVPLAENGSTRGWVIAELKRGD